MTGAGPAIVSVLAALALHLALLARFDLPQGASGTGGTVGESLAALQAAPGEMAALVAEWDAPPEVAPPPQALPPVHPEAAAPRPLPDPAPARAAVPATGATPSVDPAATPLAALPELSRPVAVVAPRFNVPPPSDPAARLSAPSATPNPGSVAPPPPPSAPPPDVAALPPDPLPAAPATDIAPRAAPPAPRPERHASGAGQGASAGQGGAAAATVTDAARQSALAAWGAAVRAAVERHQRSPAGTSAEGAVTLVLEVARDGVLNGISISASSGIAALDAAALAAVRAAAPFAAAPAALSDPVYALRLTLRFTR